MIFLCDFETTDFLKPSADFLEQPGIVQIGVVVLAGQAGESFADDITYEPWEEIHSFSTLVDPEKANWSKSAIETHGISPDMVQNAPTFLAAFPEFAALALGCDTWSGYNTKFDKDVLWHQLMRYGLEKNFPWPTKEIDVMKLAEPMQGKRGNKSPKLTEIYKQLFGEEFKAHDALEDIRATARVLKELRK